LRRSQRFFSPCLVMRMKSDLLGRWRENTALSYQREAKKVEGSGYGYGDRLNHKTVIHDRDARFYRNLSRVLQVDICCCRGLLLKSYYVVVALAGDLVSVEEEKRDLGRKEGRGRSTLSINQKADGNWLLILLCANPESVGTREYRTLLIWWWLQLGRNWLEWPHWWLGRSQSWSVHGRRHPRWQDFQVYSCTRPLLSHWL